MAIGQFNRRVHLAVAAAAAVRAITFPIKRVVVILLVAHSQTIRLSLSHEQSGVRSPFCTLLAQFTDCISSTDV